MKPSCKEVESLEGFWSRARINYAGRPVFEKAGLYRLEYNGSCWLIRKSDSLMCAFVKDPAKNPMEIKNPWTVYTHDSSTIFEKRPGWGEKELPIYTTAKLKKCHIEFVSMTHGEHRILKYKSMLS